jgi:hypothetical protein
MAEIINLYRHRKARARTEKGTQAARNRALHAIPAVERAILQAEERRTREFLERKRLESEEPKK